jgi:lysozyme family protein
MGESRAVKILQAAVNVGVDGSFGRKTADAVAAAVKLSDAKTVALALLGLRRRFYRDLAASKPEKARFLKGWLNRVDDLEKAIA